MQTGANDLQAQIEKSLQELRTARDEIRVQAHLFAMDVRKTWTELEPQLDQAEESAKKATQASAAALYDAVQAVNEFGKRLRARATNT